ncbi:MAG: hypothetical protein JO050_03035 [Acidimicrobiia bacterium]|nr:hypothetical protein [Acidimicrobiia bacterium]
MPGGFSANYICNNTSIAGSLHLDASASSAAPFVVGTSSTCSFGGVRITRSTAISNNFGAVSFGNNTTHASVSVDNNVGNPPSGITNNSIGGSLLCSGNSPKYPVSGNTISGYDSSVGGLC